MIYRTRLDQYRRRRQRSASRRHGATASPFLGTCRSAAAAPCVVPLGLRASEVGFEGSLWDLACRVGAYPGIRGLLYRAVRDGVVVWVVAPPPMTTPLTLLAATWADEISLISPTHCWSIHISAAPPAPENGYRCLFWRTP